MKASKKRTLSREEMAELYKDLRSTMSKMKDVPVGKSATKSSQPAAGKLIAQEISKALSEDSREPIVPSLRQANERSLDRGQILAVGLVVGLAVIKVTLSFIESLGVVSVTPVQAAMTYSARIANQGELVGFSREEVKILTTLDSRRAELEEKSKLLDDRARDLDTRDKEFVVRLSQLKELTDRLGGERTRDEKKKTGQLEQLANVYGAMNPQDAAQLLEQLDVTIALSLIEKMPEKRIGQIMPLMSPERALTLTRLLSGRKE